MDKTQCPLYGATFVNYDDITDTDELDEFNIYHPCECENCIMLQELNNRGITNE